jgi:hypothetical protein
MDEIDGTKRARTELEEEITSGKTVAEVIDGKLLEAKETDATTGDCCSEIKKVLTAKPIKVEPVDAIEKLDAVPGNDVTTNEEIKKAIHSRFVKDTVPIREILGKDATEDVTVKDEANVVATEQGERDDRTPDLLVKKDDTQDSVASTVVVAEDGSSIKPADASQPTVDSQEGATPVEEGAKTEGVIIDSRYPGAYVFPPFKTAEDGAA